MPLSILVYALQERLHAVAECKEALLIAQHSGLGKVQLVHDIAVYLLGVVPDDDPMILHLLMDQCVEFVRDFSHVVYRLVLV
jgi:hypothetical protein